jgi:tetratricopeptide (TPR) repeat protein
MESQQLSKDSPQSPSAFDRSAYETSETVSPAPSPGPEPPALDKDAETHYHLGIAYKEMELFDYAISEFELASSNPSMKFDCHIMLGDCYKEKGDYERAIEYYKIASGIPGLPADKLARVHFNLGATYEASGMGSEALETFQYVLKLDQSFSEAHKKIKKLQSRPK